MNGQIICAIKNCCANLAAKADEIIAAITGSTSPDYTALLNQLLASVQAVDANTAPLEAELQALNVTNAANAASNLAASNTLTQVLTELQDIDANTDDAENLLTQIRDLLNNPPQQPTNLVLDGNYCTEVGGDATTAAFRSRFYIYNTITNQITGTVWRNEDGTAETGAVAPSTDCNCD